MNTPSKHQMVIFNSKQYDVDSFSAFREQYASIGVALKFVDQKLDEESMVHAKGALAVCIFVNDLPETRVVQYLRENGTELITLRCAGFDRVDLDTCRRVGMSVSRVPVYSPYAVAEHAVALVMAVNRRIIDSSLRVAKSNFSLSNSLLGFDMHGKTVGLLGTGNIGRVAGQIFLGFGCKILCYDIFQNAQFAALPNVQYASLDDVIANADVISLHLPLLPSTRHVINRETIAKMKRGVTIVNTSRGGLIDTRALLDGIASGQVRGAGLDVYENECGYFFEDYTDKPIADAMLPELQSNPNIVLTPHQAFFTAEALHEIAKVTFGNVREFVADGKRLEEMTNTCLK